MNMENMDKTYFMPGDLVTIKHDLPNKVTMLVEGKETLAIKGADASYFKGIKCFWFTSDGLFQRQTFSTKDLIKV